MNPRSHNFNTYHNDARLEPRAQEQNNAFLEGLYGLEGAGYFGGKKVTVEQSKANLIIYLSQFDLKGQSISLLKFCESLRKRGEAQFQTTLVTPGLMPEVVQLIEDKLIGYAVVNDADEEIARRLGLKSGESGTFYFDNRGTCRFSSRQQPDPQDLQKLIASQGSEASSASEVEFGRGKALPSLSLIEAQSLRRVRIAELSANNEQAWVFFLADCFSCGPPNPDAYLQDFTVWQKLAKNIKTTPIVVFDSAFLRRQVVTAWERFGLKSPVFVSEEDLRSLSKFALSRGLQPTRPLIVRTDMSRTVTNISVIAKPGEAKSARSNQAAQSSPGKSPAYLRTFQDLGLDVYDVDSHNGLYYVSGWAERGGNLLSDKCAVGRLNEALQKPNSFFEIFTPDQVWRRTRGLTRLGPVHRVTSLDH